MALTAITADYSLNMAYGQSSPYYTTPNEIKDWVLNGLVLDKYPTGLTLIGTTLTQTLADLSTLTVDLSTLGSTPAIEVSSVTFNDTTSLLTLTKSDASTIITDLSALDTPAIVSGLYDSSTTSIIFTKTDASTVIIGVDEIDNKWYAIGSALDVTGTFDETHTTSDYVIPGDKGNVTIMLDNSATVGPSTLKLPEISGVPMGWECNMLMFDSSSSGTNKTISVDGGLASLYSTISDPLPTTSPYSNLVTSIILEPQHFYRIKKVNSEFYIIHYK